MRPLVILPNRVIQRSASPTPAPTPTPTPAPAPVPFSAGPYAFPPSALGPLPAYVPGGAAAGGPPLGPAAAAIAAAPPLAGAGAAAASSVGPVRRSRRIAGPRYTHRALGLVAGRMIRATSIDKRGVKYWNGYRNSLGWSAAVKAVMKAVIRLGCQIRRRGCKSKASSIDHILDFATTQSALGTREYCDGSYHWRGILFRDALRDYNNVRNLQWACKSCNSSKSGAKGLYSPPSYAGQCPGAATCRL